MTRQLSSQSYFGLGQVPTGIGAVLNGWGISEEQYRNPSRFPVVDFRAMTEACPHNCFHCFTNKNKKTLSLEEIKNVIDQIAQIGASGINYVGEGEPTIDPDFFPIIEYTSSNGLVPIVFTDAATRLRDSDFARRLFYSGASVSPKCDSLFNADYQNWVVGDNTGTYSNERDEVIRELIRNGFTQYRKDGTTRLGFDMVVTQGNKTEVEKTLRFCRENNIWVGFSWFLHCGRSGKEDFDTSLSIPEEERNKIREIISKVDSEYGFNHQIYRNFGTFPCIELMQVFGDGRVSVCAGSDFVVGNVKNDSIRTLQNRLYDLYPRRNRSVFDGNCLCRYVNEIADIGGKK